jgi:hypothetical protein
MTSQISEIELAIFSYLTAYKKRQKVEDCNNGADSLPRVSRFFPLRMINMGTVGYMNQTSNLADF